MGMMPSPAPGDPHGRLQAHPPHARRAGDGGRPRGPCASRTAAASTRRSLNGPGALRVTTLHTGADPRVTFVFGAHSPTDLATAWGEDGVVTMSDGNQPADVPAPGLHVAPDRTMTLDVQGRFARVGRLPTGVAGGKGVVTDPSGQTAPRLPTRTSRGSKTFAGSPSAPSMERTPPPLPAPEKNAT